MTNLTIECFRTCKPISGWVGRTDGYIWMGPSIEHLTVLINILTHLKMFCRSCAASVACNMVSVAKGGDCLFHPGVSTKDKDLTALLLTDADKEDAIYIMECAGGKQNLQLIQVALFGG